jgi:hypothetical protein
MERWRRGDERGPPRRRLVSDLEPNGPVLKVDGDKALMSWARWLEEVRRRQKAEAALAEALSKLERVEAEFAAYRNEKGCVSCATDGSEGWVPVAAVICRACAKEGLLDVEAEAGALREALEDVSPYVGMCMSVTSGRDFQENARRVLDAIKSCLSGTAGRVLLDELAALREIARWVQAAGDRVEPDRELVAALQKLEAVRHPKEGWHPSKEEPVE